MNGIPKPGETTIGWVGTGVMGAAMAGHLQNAGYQLCVHNRTRSKAESLHAGGARWCDTPAEVAKSSDVIFTIVGFPQDVHSIYFGESGILSAVRSGAILVDMTTSDPTLARKIAAYSLIP